jgi:hypothetical protein
MEDDLRKAISFDSIFKVWELSSSYKVGWGVDLRFMGIKFG